MMGRVCEKHNEFYETTCRWCEPSVLADFANAAWIPAHAGEYSAADLMPPESCDVLHANLDATEKRLDDACEAMANDLIYGPIE